MQGKFKSKDKHIKKDKFKKIIEAYCVENPKKPANKLLVKKLERQDLKQSRYPNNSMKKKYKKIIASKNRRIQRDWIKKKEWEAEMPTHHLTKSIIRMII